MVRKRFRARLLCLLVGITGWWLSGAVFGQTAATGSLSVEASKAIDTHIDSRIEGLMDQLGRTQYPTTAAISPDGNYVAWSLLTANGAELHLTRLAKGSAQDRIISPDTIADKANTHAGACTGDWPVWS